MATLGSRPPANRIRFVILFRVLFLTSIPAALLWIPPSALADPAGASAENAGSLKPATLVRPVDITRGALLFESVKEGYYVEAPTVATHVEIDVTGPIARTKVTQHFENPGESWVEGIYVFPLPDGSAVDTLRMQIGNRYIEGKIKEKQEARQIYEQARREGRKASLLEQERANIFTNSVANIGPNETVIVQIEYQEAVRQSEGVFSLRFPMVVGPRYSPEPEVRNVTFREDEMWADVNDPVPDRARISPPVLHPDAGKVNPIALTVNLKAGFPLGEIKSHHHEMTIGRTDEREASLTLKKGEVPADKDFELTWKPASGKAPAAALFREAVNGEHYLLAMVTPPEGAAALESRPREAIFVIDNSGSMAGQSIRQAKASLLLALSKLKPEDTFNVIRFDDTLGMVFPTAVQASQPNIQHATGFVSGLQAEGGTEMLPALKAALMDHNPGDTGRVRQVIFLTDGAIGNEEQLFAEINAHLGRSRLFTVGIGSAPNTFFMTRAAEAGRGTFTHIGSEEQVAERMNALFTKLESPVMTGLEMDWPAKVLLESWPNPLPDLYKGEPIVLSAKVGAVDGTLSLTGELAGKPWQVDLPLARAREGKGVAKLWARKKIAALEAMRYAGTDWQSVDRKVLEVALTHHLVSRRTSLVAVDVTPSRPQGEEMVSAEVPTNLPEGWDFDKVFGEPVPATREASAPPPTAHPDQARLALQQTATPNRPIWMSIQVTSSAKLALPQTATPALLMILTGLLSLLLGVALLLWWRRARRVRT